MILQAVFLRLRFWPPLPDPVFASTTKSLRVSRKRSSRLLTAIHTKIISVPTLGAAARALGWNMGEGLKHLVGDRFDHRSEQADTNLLAGNDLGIIHHAVPEPRNI